VIALTSRSQPSLDIGVGGRFPIVGGASVSRRVLVAIALACLAFAGVLYVGLARERRPAASVAGSHVESQASLLSLPLAAQGQVSSALGRDQAAYRINGLLARNPVQRLSAQFGRSGVSITTGSTRFAISLKGFGRGQALRTLAPVSPTASANRVSYARGSVREWWANGPLGLEQGFDIARRPVGSGALTLSLAVPARARLDRGTVSLPGGLRYSGVHATGAGGRVLPSWLEVRGGRVLVRVDDRGAKYPVLVDPYVQQAELTASGALTEEFLGYSVAVAGDTAVVGAPHQKFPQPVQPSSDPYPGAVYVFELGAGGWAQTAKLTAPDGNANGLGWSVGISETGTTIVAGAPGPPSASNPCDTTEGNTDPGQAYVYSMPEGGWSNMTSATATLTASDACPGDALGWSVGISGSTVVVGAPWGPTVADENEPGYPPVPEQGEVYEYTMPSGGWKSMHQTAELTANNPSGEDVHLGWSVAVSGGTIVAGDPEQGVGSHGDAGAAYVFVKPAGEWTSTHQTAELTASDPDPGNDRLATSVAVSGNTIVAGAPFHQVGAHGGQGAAYVFVKPAGEWANNSQSAELTATDGTESDELGYSVAVSGATVVAGARKHQVSEYADQGAAYVFSEPSGGWSGSQTQAQELVASDGKTLDSLGESIAISGNTILAGAPRRLATSEEPHEEGAAYIFGLGSAPSEGSTGGGTTTSGGSSGGGVTLPGPTPPPTARVVSISGGHARITVVLSCPSGGAACVPASLKAIVKEHLKGKKITAITASGQAARITTKRVLVAGGGVTLLAGTDKTLALKLNATGRALLSKFGKLSVAVTVVSGGKTIDMGTVKVLKATKPKK
jgi:FG-GAP repeat